MTSRDTFVHMMVTSYDPHCPLLTWSSYQIDNGYNYTLGTDDHDNSSGWVWILRTVVLKLIRGLVRIMFNDYDYGFSITENIISIISNSDDEDSNSNHDGDFNNLKYHILSCFFFYIGYLNSESCVLNTTITNKKI